MKRWGYLLGLIIGIIHIVGGISGILFGFMLVAGLLVLIFGLVIVVYLRRSGVEDEFE